jgi:uncharacterized protein YegP (UPF0339 family)
VTQLLIVIGKTVDNKYYFRIRTDDGRILLTSREFVHIEKCMNEIYGIQQYSDFETVEQNDRYNGHRYTLIGAWGRMVGESPFYNYSYEMKKDIDLVKKLLHKAEVIDNSASIRFFRPVKIK